MLSKNTTFSKIDQNPPQTLYTSTCTRMCMATKTLTITEDSYTLLADNKLENESFSQEITRLLTKRNRRSLGDYFGILPEKLGDAMLKDLTMIREKQIQLTKKRIA